MKAISIHKEILKNIYQDDVIVCDVSGRNPNVFFELGIRMATQKPVVLIKDDVTDFPFDTSPNRFVPYRRDLRYPNVQRFVDMLADRILLAKDQTPENSFIGQLGPFKIPEVESSEIPLVDAINERFDRIERRLMSPALRQRSALKEIEKSGIKVAYEGGGRASVFAPQYPHSALHRALTKITQSGNFSDVDFSMSPNSTQAIARISDLTPPSIEEFLARIIVELDDDIPF